MKFEIKHRISGAILFSVEAENWRFAVEAAVKAKTDLRYADLRYADLRYADPSYADLSYADLRYADLRYAKGINKDWTTPLRILIEQPGPVWAYKLINEKGEGIYNGGINYLNGEKFTTSLNSDENQK